jgi:hypothetical protein
MLPFNTISVFSHLLSAFNCTALQKATVAPIDEFDAKAEDGMQHIAQFTQCCEEIGIMEDFNCIESKNPPPSDVDLSNPIEKAAWINYSHRFNSN